MIQLENVTKYFGDFPAITDISFKVEKGERIGFLGPNGAGKSTTMKIVTGFMPPTTGNITVAGYDIVSQSLDARRHIGYLPETVPLYTDMFVNEYLRFMGTIRGMPRNKIARRIDDTAVMARDRLAHDLAVVAKRAQSRGLVVTHQARVAHHIRHHDGGQPARFTFTCHELFRNERPQHGSCELSDGSLPYQPLGGRGFVLDR